MECSNQDIRSNEVMERRAVDVPFPNTSGVERPSTEQPSPPQLAQCPQILDEFVEAVRQLGVVGEERAAKLLYLTLTTRLLDRPVSAVVKGPSSGGKSYIVEQVLTFFPQTAYYALTAMSERTLAYDDEPLRQRFLVIYEAAGLVGETASYLVRSLLSEGRIRYKTVERNKEGALGTKLIEREGPTGLLLTTTRISLHPENETRLLSIPVNDSREQTAEVMRAIAGRSNASREPDHAWLELQRWLEDAEHRVSIPYAKALAEAIPPVAMRLRRDFDGILKLIEAHAMLHQMNRARDRHGWIVATLDDYAIVRDLVSDLVAQNVGASVPHTIRKTVAAVSALIAPGSESATVTQVADVLNVDKSAASRRVWAAINAGYLDNLEERKGRPAKLALGEPMPEERKLLPSADDLRLSGCTVDRRLPEGGTRQDFSLSCLDGEARANA